MLNKIRMMQLSTTSSTTPAKLLNGRRALFRTTNSNEVVIWDGRCQPQSDSKIRFLPIAWERPVGINLLLPPGCGGDARAERDNASHWVGRWHTADLKPLLTLWWCDMKDKGCKRFVCACTCVCTCVQMQLRVSVSVCVSMVMFMCVCVGACVFSRTP